LWAAVLACGDGAVLSHWSAAGAWALRRNGRDAIDVTVGPGGRAPRTGISVHRSTTLTPEQALTRGGLPITTPGRTVLDLAAAGVTELQLEELLDRAERLLFGFDDLHAVLAAHPRRPGAPALRALLSEYDPGATATRSEMERRFLRLCDRHGIARPRVNGIVEGFEVDFTWRRQRLVVEVDGYAFHSSRTAFETDRARDVRLVLSGFRVLRFTWRQLTRRGSDVAKGLRHALSTS
jgi:very-short-patch-repair endonuclease